MPAPNSPSVLSAVKYLFRSLCYLDIIVRPIYARPRLSAADATFTTPLCYSAPLAGQTQCRRHPAPWLPNLDSLRIGSVCISCILELDFLKPLNFTLSLLHQIALVLGLAFRFVLCSCLHADLLGAPPSPWWPSSTTTTCTEAVWDVV